MGEHKRVVSAGVSYVIGDGAEVRSTVDLGASSFARSMAYLLSWSFTRDGQPVAISAESLSAL